MTLKSLVAKKGCQISSKQGSEPHLEYEIM